MSMDRVNRHVADAARPQWRIAKAAVWIALGYLAFLIVFLR